MAYFKLRICTGEGRYPGSQLFTNRSLQTWALMKDTVKTPLQKKYRMFSL